ncbi:MAG: uracil-DNA glycosylase, partial [Betaproteobacteria bacterium]|nr:uracil-DNA glycosylase [Betaproteobacteria bacterium]
MTDPTCFDLDERQRAMLAEMGVRVWWPERGVEAVATPAAGAVHEPEAAPQAPVARPMPVPVAATVEPSQLSVPAGVDGMDWATLQATVAECRACKLCQTRQNTVFGVGEQGADWMVIGEAPGEHEDQQGEPFVGEAGKLLDNMLKAIGLSRQTDGRAQGQAG